MYSNILIPVALDHDHDVADAVAVARALLAEGGQMTAFHVIEEVPAYVQTYLPDGHTERLHKEIAARLKAGLGDADQVKTAIQTGHAGRTIVEYAKAAGCDLIVVASHRPGLQDYLLGSTATQVVRHAECAVHVMR